MSKLQIQMLSADLHYEVFLLLTPCPSSEDFVRWASTCRYFRDWVRTWHITCYGFALSCRPRVQLQVLVENLAIHQGQGSMQVTVNGFLALVYHAEAEKRFREVVGSVLAVGTFTVKKLQVRGDENKVLLLIQFILPVDHENRKLLLAAFGMPPTAKTNWSFVGDKGARVKPFYSILNQPDPDRMSMESSFELHFLFDKNKEQLTKLPWKQSDTNSYGATYFAANSDNYYYEAIHAQNATEHNNTYDGESTELDESSASDPDADSDATPPLSPEDE